MRSTRPSASSRRIACVTLVTCTCSRSDALVIGSAPPRLNANNRNNSYREKLRSYSRSAFSTGRQNLVRPHHRRNRDHAVGDLRPNPKRSQLVRANAMGSRLRGHGG